MRRILAISWAAILLAYAELPAASPDLLSEFRNSVAPGLKEIVFAVRRLGEDPHWYANFGSTLDHSNWRTYLDGGRLCRLDLDTGTLTVLLDAPKGGVRDPQLHYDGKTILFSYRRPGSPYFHLNVIGLDGSGLREITTGPFDDVEPTWLPDGNILFISTRCNRRVNCHTTQTAVLYRCRPDGTGLRELSSNNEHDNTPWMLPGGQVLYTRWEYVDRNQLSYHHLWVANPDGTRQMVFFGNQNPGTTIIDAKPVPGSRKIVASFSPGHGRREHDGVITLIDPRKGPEALDFTWAVSDTPAFRDPWAFSEHAFLAAHGGEIVLLNDRKQMQSIYRLPGPDIGAGFQCHEPRPVGARTMEPVLASQSNWRGDTGRLVLSDVYRGRNMEGVQPGEIKKLLVLETLPKPMNYTGGAEPLTFGGSFTLERVLGTVPVEPDGSAYLELPALRSLFFVALDENDLSVKRMQSFLTVMPGETTGCVGCHEQRVEAPPGDRRSCAALRRPPSRIEPERGVPDVFDFPRDIQPVLNRLCLPCHDGDRQAGGVALSGDRGPLFSISYYTLIARGLVSDGRNGPGNRPPRSLGSSASRLLTLMDGSHHGAKATPLERRLVRLWIETGVPYPGTYAALGTGMIGGFEIVDRLIRMDREDLEWPSTQAAMAALTRRCGNCHDQGKPLPLTCTHLVGPNDRYKSLAGTPPWIQMTPDDVRRRWARDLLYNLSRPEKSLLLLAPLSHEAGGLARCGAPVFASTGDEDCRLILAAIQDAARKLDRIKRFDMPGFRPRAEWIAEMKRMGILPQDLRTDQPIDVYATERAYWESLWYRPVNP